MVLTGRVKSESLGGTPSIGADGEYDTQGWAEIDGYVVPRRVAYIIDGTRRSPSARIEFEVRGNAVECVSVSIVAGASGRGIGNGDLNSLPDLQALGYSTVEQFAIRRPSKDVLAGILESGITVEEKLDRVGRAVIIDRDARGERATLRRQLRDAPRKAQVELAAEIYRQNIDNAPTEAVATALGISRRTAARRLDEAREAGLLPKTTQGKRKA